MLFLMIIFLPLLASIVISSHPIGLPYFSHQIASMWMTADPSWSSFQREDDPSPPTSDLSSPPQRDIPSSSSTVNPPPRPGWNSSHQYTNCFKHHHTASVAVVSSDFFSLDRLFVDSLYSTFIVLHDYFPVSSSTDFSFFDHFAYDAASNRDILHYVAMIKDPDWSLFLGVTWSMKYLTYFALKWLQLLCALLFLLVSLFYLPFGFFIVNLHLIGPSLNTRLVSVHMVASKLQASIFERYTLLSFIGVLFG